MVFITLLFIYILIYIFFLKLTLRNSPLLLEPKSLNISRHSSSIALEIIIEITNQHSRMEVMIPEFKIKPVLLSDGRTNDIQIRSKLTPMQVDLPKRGDGYWQAFIIKSKSSTIIQYSLTLEEQKDSNYLKQISNIWIDIFWVNYGPFGRINCRDGFIAPLKFPKSEINKINNSNNPEIVIPIKTHKLGTLDDPISVINKYTTEHILPGDIVTIGETPLAIMQGRYLHPSVIRTSNLSKVLCYFFHPTSSLATACGMQTLINEAGAFRVLFAWTIGSFFKMFNIKGIFYRLAGEQARLIDDITGTTYPYDQLIVLGPKNVKGFCEIASKQLGVHLAVVDVNDLGKVKILGSTKGADEKLIHNALRSNPAGNSDEQTPIVIIRPS